jgi:hypothetical protein
MPIHTAKEKAKNKAANKARLPKATVVVAKPIKKKDKRT